MNSTQNGAPITRKPPEKEVQMPTATQTATSTWTIDPTVAPAVAGSRWIALVVLCAGMLMIILDQTIVNVALPSIQSDLGFSQSSLVWVVNAYLIPFRRPPLAAGRLGDPIG